MKIGELAGQAQTQTETIRFYEREGLLPHPGRTDSNYRVYGPEHVARLSFIRHCRSLDMSLSEIKELLEFRDTQSGDCLGVEAVLDRHIGHVDVRIKGLKKLRRELELLRESCKTNGSGAPCGILSGIEHATGLDSLSEEPHEAHIEGAHRKVRRLPKQK